VVVDFFFLKKKTNSFFWVGLSICGGLFLFLVAVGVDLGAVGMLFCGCHALI
jgi:hypothetical protein